MIFLHVVILALASSLIFLLSCSSTGHIDPVKRTQVLPVMTAAEPPDRIVAKDALNLVSINLAHGRKDSLNQLLVSAKKIRENLDDIATFLMECDADVVALQEADGPSPWSGGFDHISYLAREAGFPYYVYTEHAKLWMGNYGTALLSKWPIQSAIGLTFPSTPPTASKGFTLAQIQWLTGGADESAILVDVVSVHLDFSRKSVRRQQIDELASVLHQRQNTLVIMGDFNSKWLVEKYLIESFADASPLHVYNTSSEKLNTYKDQRLDWILLTRDLGFDSYRVETEVLSDHRAVVAAVHLRPAKGKP